MAPRVGAPSPRLRLAPNGIGRWTIVGRAAVGRAAVGGVAAAARCARPGPALAVPATTTASSTAAISGVGRMVRSRRPARPRAEWRRGARRARTVRAATRQAKAVASTTRVVVGQLLAAEARARHQARKPPPNASPAPMVSTTSTGGAGTATSPPAVTTSAPSPPRVSSTTGGTGLEQRAGRGLASVPGLQPREVLLGDLDDVRCAASTPPQARAVGVGVGDDDGRQLGSTITSACSLSCRDDGLERARHRLERRAPACRRGGSLTRRAARRARRPASGPGADVPRS